MPKINKLALTRLALRYVIKEASREEKLCILTDMYCPIRDGVRWWGGNGYGVSALDQGIYSHVTMLRRVADLWLKLEGLHANMVEEQRIIRDLCLEELTEADREEIFGQPSKPALLIPEDELPEPKIKREPQPVNSGPEQMRLAVGSSNGPYAPSDHSAKGYSL